MTAKCSLRVTGLILPVFCAHVFMNKTWLWSFLFLSFMLFSLHLIFFFQTLLRWSCFRNIYTCHKEGPKHISVAVDTLSYRLPYSTICGGVISILKDHFKEINGFANSLYGWGGEDDDLSRRIQLHNLTVVRSPANIARFHMLTHDQVLWGQPKQTYISLTFVIACSMAII